MALEIQADAVACISERADAVGLRADAIILDHDCKRVGAGDLDGRSAVAREERVAGDEVSRFRAGTADQDVLRILDTNAVLSVPEGMGPSDVSADVIALEDIARMVGGRGIAKNVDADLVGGDDIPPGGGAPTILFPPLTSVTPSPLLSRATVPVTSRPMMLPSTWSREPEPPIKIPALLPEMTLPGAAPGVAVKPPTRLLPASTIKTPRLAFGNGSVPFALVPMKLPCTRLLVAPAPLISMPLAVGVEGPPFPEMTFRAVGVLPPMRLSAPL